MLVARMNRPHSGLAALCGAVLWIGSCTPSTVSIQHLDYRDAVEGAAGLYFESLATPHAALYNLGPTSTAGLSQYAIKIGANADQDDDGARNAILIECGMHAREWFAAESCYWFVDHLINTRDDPATRRLWQNVDIWVIPQSNPAGRQIDDLSSGDPTQYLHYCKDGPHEGSPCPDGDECGSGNTCAVKGWRNNANRPACSAGVNLARNFSTDWDGAEGDCDSSAFEEYRGEFPFSELETLNLRRFVHNHMISMAVVVHTTALKVWHMWNDRQSAATYMVDQLVAINRAAVGGDPEAALQEKRVGTTSGQFSAWLAFPSDASEELDHRTQRGISTVFLELPIQPTTEYESGDYDASGFPSGDDRAYRYQFDRNDGSNRFHPSSSIWYGLWQDSVRPMYEYVVRQAESPGCPLNDGFSRLTDHCEANDFGLVGMKIAKQADRPGALSFDPASRRETLVAGSYSIVFAVQNFSVSGSPTINPEVRIYRDPRGSRDLVSSNAVPITGLSPGARRVEAVQHYFRAGEEYLVEVELKPNDDFGDNNKKSMAFQVSPMPAGAPPPGRERFVRRFELRQEEREGARRTFTGEVRLDQDEVKPLAAGEVEIAVFPVRTAAFPKPYLWKTSIVPRTPSPGQADVSSQAAALSVVDSEQSAQLALTPSKSSEDHSLTLTTESPSLARALAHFGKVSLRISAPDRSVSVVGWLSRDGEGRLMMRPKRMVTDVDSEPP